MMGRSHALLGALGYALMEPAANIPLPLNRPIDTGIWLVAAGVVALAPETNDRRWISWVSDPIYKLLSFAVVLSGFILAANWLYQFFPQLFPTSPIDRLVWMAVATAFALIPDIDEQKSTVSTVLGPLARPVSKGIRRMSGGHRGATHSWIFVVFGLALAVEAQFSNIAAGIIIVLCCMLAARMLLPDSEAATSVPVMLIAAVMGLLAFFGLVNSAPILLAIPVGVILHDLGDWVTRQGIAFWYPHKRKYRLNLFGTNTPTEYWVVRPILIVSLVVTIFLWVGLSASSWIHSENVRSYFYSYHGIESLRWRDTYSLWSWLWKL